MSIRSMFVDKLKSHNNVYYIYIQDQHPDVGHVT